MRYFLAVLIFVSATASAKSSEIPARRDFPLNEAVNPCEDFYKYACSKVQDSFQLREDRSRHDFAFDDSAERLLEAKKKYFAQLTTVAPKTPREEMLKNYYLACMDPAAGAADEKATVQTTLSQLAEIKDRGALLDRLVEYVQIGKDAPIGFGFDSNQDKPLFKDVVPVIHWLSLPEKSYYEKAEVVEDWRKVVTKFFHDVGASDAEGKARVVVDFEKGLAKVYLTPSQFRDIMATRTGITKEELKKQFPNLRLESLLERVPDHTHIRHILPDALAYLNERLGTLSIEDLRTLVTYNLLFRELDDAYPEYFDAKFKFENRNFGGPAVRPVRHERCTKDTMRRFLPELDSILWPQIFPGFVKSKVVALSEKIRTAIVAALNGNKWLSKSARREASTKITKAHLQLVSPENDEEWNFRPLAKYETNHPLQNSHQFRRLMLDKDLNELKGPTNPNRWGMGPLTINAYYDEAFNKFVLPVGILQYPFYDSTGMLDVNLAAVGTVIGHELGHGIDDKGSLYDSKGVLRQWMTPADLAGFKERSHKLVAQFDKAGMNGTFTLGENIGDLVGLTASHYAAFGAGYEEKNQKREQAFFVQYARVWCDVERPKFAEARIKSDPHSLSIARVNEQMKQQVNFAKAFQCKAGDPMVLPMDQLVKIW